ncbi:anti-sigma factor family protein [Anabaena sp. UHCC 0399]|uniref:anti-sigma factor family protein n=1 Tax=Anabaena sp. UHCC 0399 TaxID=3110238 RepID=UPI002B1EDEEC|nr:zf-HC2 domain-containing protein [Anabaena sp. UHCC 0399]MEA5565671.1 zf-HC2 domain-containing protein [Anabaena sp. UHCC 0399]
MTTDSQFNDPCRWQIPRDLPNEMAKHTNEATGAMDMVKRDRFELLSAYLDGEVTAAERRQVEDWLANDASVQRLYSRLLKLRQGLRTMPVPTTQTTPETTADQVFARINRRSRIKWVFGGAAIAACMIGALSSWLPNRESGILQLAQQPQAQPTQAAAKSELLPMIALNNPVMEIPKAATSSPKKLINQPSSGLGEVIPNIN